MAKYQAVTKYIEEYWQTCSYTPDNKGRGVMRLGRVKLPFTTISPNHLYFAGTQFYWDTYFTVLGLVVAGHADMAKAMIDNLVFMFDKFDLVPARNSWTSLGRTQPPYLTQMAFEVYDHGGADKAWLAKVLKIAEQEYWNVWMSGQRFNKQTGLSRYSPRFWKKHLTVYESGWDNSSRFNPENYKTLIPVDLNCQLYQYESDFARYARLINDKVAIKKWQKAMVKRQELINKYFWDAKTGFYYDYNPKTKRPENLKTLAGFYPLWCGAASNDQAKKALVHIKSFEYQGGLSNTEKIVWSKKQWDYPNGWAPQQYIVFKGLKNYGFDKQANQLAGKWLVLNQKVFERTGTLWEKYDVVKGDIGLSGRYPTQPGFAWTNAIFLRLVHELL